MNTYTYTAADGDVITGTLEDIGETVCGWHGDRATQDNLEPWIELDDDGTESPRDFSYSEFIHWLSKAEDRPVKHVQRALRGNIAGVELCARRKLIGLSQEEFAASFETHVAQNLISQWETGRQSISGEALYTLLHLEDLAQTIINNTVWAAKKLSEEGVKEAEVKVWRSNRELWAAHPEMDGTPAALHLVATARGRFEAIQNGYCALELVDGAR